LSVWRRGRLLIDRELKFEVAFLDGPDDERHALVAECPPHQEEPTDSAISGDIRLIRLVATTLPCDRTAFSLDQSVAWYSARQCAFQVFETDDEFPERRTTNKFWSNSLNAEITVYFACRSCGLIYRAKQVRASQPVSSSIDCVGCHGKVHSWHGSPYDYIGWQPEH
jgi:hypothetical protein